MAGGRYQASVTVTFHRATDQAARERGERIAEFLRAVFLDSNVQVTTYAEKPLPLHRQTDAQLRAGVNEFTQDDPPPYRNEP